LQTEDWMWSQTPQFTLTLQPFVGAEIELTLHHGVFKTVDAKGDALPNDILEKLRAALIDHKLSDIRDWDSFLCNCIGPWHDSFKLIASRLDNLLPVPDFIRH